MNTITIPRPIRYEMQTRLEECGAYSPNDDRYPLWQKITKSTDGKLEINDDERVELIYHCETMIEIAVEQAPDEVAPFSVFEKQLRKEARYAAVLLTQLK